MDAPDYYSVLGVPETASPDEVKAAWRTLARRYHPDAQRGGEAERAAAEESMKRVNEAYAVLGDAERRAKYDEYRRLASAPRGRAGGVPGGSAGGPSQEDLDELLRSIFAGMGGGPGGFGGFGGFEGFDMGGLGGMGGMGGFGRGTGGPAGPQGGDMEASMPVPLRLACLGGRQTVRLPDGRTVTVTVPAGTRDGARLRLRGLGEARPGGGRGDLTVRVSLEVPDGVEVDGRDLRADFDVPFDAAILGAELRVPLPNGRATRVRVPAGTTAGRGFTVRGAGLGPDGDCRLRARITVPAELTDRQRRLIAEAMGRGA